MIANFRQFKMRKTFRPPLKHQDNNFSSTQDAGTSVAIPDMAPEDRVEAIASSSIPGMRDKVNLDTLPPGQVEDYGNLGDLVTEQSYLGAWVPDMALEGRVKGFASYSNPGLDFHRPRKDSLKLAGTVEVKDDLKKLKNAPNDEELRARYKKSVTVKKSPLEQAKNALKESRQESRYRFVAQKRTLKIGELEEWPGNNSCDKLDAGGNDKESNRLSKVHDVISEDSENENGERELSNLGASTNIGQIVAQGGDASPTEEARMAPEVFEKKMKALVAEILLEYNTKRGSTPNVNKKHAVEKTQQKLKYHEKRLKNTQSYSQHIKEDLVENLTVYSCKTCQKFCLTTNKIVAERHAKTHGLAKKRLRVSSFVYKCSFCGEIHKTKKGSILH